MKGGYRAAGDAVRSAFAVTDYGSDKTIDPNFDYNKFDWGDVSATVNSWANGTDENLKTLATKLSPYLTSSAGDVGIYKAGELANQASTIQAQGDINAQNVQWNAVLNGDGSANTIAFLKQNQADSLANLQTQATLLKQQMEANTASGQEQVNADYAGVADEIIAGVGKLQAMTVDEYAARGMAFSGTLNRATADVASAGATELAKAMAQKGARLGKLVNDMVAYTAQVGMDVLTKSADVVAQYGLQMASLLDKDAQTRSDAKAALAVLSVKQNTLNQLGPVNDESAKLQADQSYAAALAQAKAEEAKAKAATAKLIFDQSIAQQNADTSRISATGSVSGTTKYVAPTVAKPAAVVEPFKSLAEAQGPIDDYIALQNQLSGLTPENGKWYRNVLDPVAAAAGITQYNKTEMLPAEVTNLQGKIARLEPEYRAAIAYRDAHTGTTTPISLAAKDQSDVDSFINTVISPQMNPGIAGAGGRGVQPGQLSALVESYLQGTLDGKPMTEWLSPAAMAAIRAWVKTQGG